MEYNAKEKTEMEKAKHIYFQIALTVISISINSRKPVEY